MNTQPSHLQVRSKFGPHTNGGEVDGSGAYHYAVILGFTKGLDLRIWGNDSRVERLKVLPSTTVNKESSYSDTDGWSIGGGATFNIGGSLGKTSGSGLFGSKGKSSGLELGMQLSFNFGFTHQSTRQWTASDYEIIPKPYRSGSNISVAGWTIDVNYPHL